MDKAPDAFRTISEVAEAISIAAHVLRFWETRFPQIKPVKRAGGRRYYRPSDVALVAGIRQLLHIDGLTIREVQKVLRDKGVRHVATLGGAKAGDLDRAAAAALEPVVLPTPAVVAQVVPLTQPSRRPNTPAPSQAATIQTLFPLDPLPPPVEPRDPAPIARKPRPPVVRVVAAQADQPTLPFILAPEAPHIWVEPEDEALFDPIPLHVASARQATSSAQALATMAAQLHPLPAPAAAQSRTALRDLHRRLSVLHTQMAQAPLKQN